MFRKTYSVDAIEWQGLFMINGVLTPITFSGGKQGNGRRLKARFSTSDVNIQKAIETDQRYSKTVFFEVAYEEIEDEKQEEVPGKKVYNCNKLQEAVNVLITEYGEKPSTLTNKAKILEAANKHQIVFPNIK